jgi:signal transduction histidine kinase
MRTGKKPLFSPPLLRSRVGAAVSRAVARDGAPSIDALDAAIRGFGVAIVVLLSLLGYGRSHEPYLLDYADPLLVAAGLVIYNLVVISVVGVPWRTSPTFPLFVLDWTVASAAILFTGGYLSPFIILYYALVIGAALRVGLSRSLALIAGCAVVFVVLSLLNPEPIAAVRLPILVVQITSLVMVMFMSVGMKRAFEVEVHKVRLEEQAADRLRLLNNLIHVVLSGPPDLERVVRSVAQASSEAMNADSGMAVLVEQPSPYEDALPGHIGEEHLLIVTDCEPNPASLSVAEHEMLVRVMSSARPVITQQSRSEDVTAAAFPRFPGLERGGKKVCAISCVPFMLDSQVIGALFVGRYSRQPFTGAELSLLTAISQQLAVAVRLARLYEMEREKAVRSEERERLERDLLSIVSHELRTPLTSIKTSIGALSDPNRDYRANKAVEARLLLNIERSTERLITLVNELLDMARLRAGRVSLNLQELNMADLLSDVASQVRPLIDARHQAVELDLPAPGSPRWARLKVLADRRRLEQVLLNLLANANKYGPAGTTITVGATPRDGLVKVFVRDEGPGIPSGEHGLIFDKFYRGSLPEEGPGKLDGSGLGLAIARSLIELHGGTIGVQSKVGRGSTFFFTLPQEISPPEGDLLVSARGSAASE